MVHLEIKAAANTLLTLLEKHNTPGFLVIPEPHNPFYCEVTFPNNKLHDYLREITVTAMMKDQYERIVVLQDERALINALKTYKNVDSKFEENVKDVFKKAGCSDEFTASILNLVLNEDNKIDRSLAERRIKKNESYK